MRWAQTDLTMRKINNQELQRVFVAATITITAMFAWQYLTNKTSRVETHRLADIQIAEQVEVSTQAMIEYNDAQEAERIEAEKVAKAKAEAEKKAAEEAARQAEAAQVEEVAVVTPKPVVEPVVQPQSVSEAEAKMFIYMRESGNNPAAVNPIGCRGLGQACPGSKLPCSDTDYSCQDAFFTNYAMTRYGSWVEAYHWWLQNHWW